MSSEPQDSHQRLQERITYCEHLVDTLNGVVADLQKRVLSLEQQNRRLAEAMRQQQEASRLAVTAAEKPPHY